MVTSTTGTAADRIGTEAHVPVTLRLAMSCAVADPAIARARQPSTGILRMMSLLKRHAAVSGPLNRELTSRFRAEARAIRARLRFGLFPVLCRDAASRQDA